MKGFRTIALLIVVNLLIGITLMITGSILLNVVLPMFGIDLRGSFASAHFLWAAVFGFGGAFISLLFSKTFARKAYQMQRVETPQTPKEHLVYDTIGKLANDAGIKMPEVWVYWDDSPNAFATGPTRNNAMIAVSSGLVNNLSDREVQAVLAHEVGHVVNGDMMATTLLQGVMNTFVYWFAALVANLVTGGNDEEEGSSPFAYMMVNMVLQMLFSVLAMIPICWFSRQREFRADAYAARAVGAAPMIAALQRLETVSQVVPEQDAQPALATMKINGNSSGFAHLFATHPAIADRVAALRNL